MSLTVQREDGVKKREYTMGKFNNEKFKSVAFPLLADRAVTRFGQDFLVKSCRGYYQSGRCYQSNCFR